MNDETRIPDSMTNEQANDETCGPIIPVASGGSGLPVDGPIYIQVNAEKPKPRN
jgi:hypothetical protein